MRHRCPPIFRRTLIGLLIAYCVCFFVKTDFQVFPQSCMEQEAVKTIEGLMYDIFCPCISFTLESEHKAHWLLQNQIDVLFPLYGYIIRNIDETEDKEQEENLLRREITKESLAGSKIKAIELEAGIEEKVAEENEVKREQIEESRKEESLVREAVGFLPHEKLVQVDLAALADKKVLEQLFYTVDGSTCLKSDTLQVEKFLEKDMRINREVDGPQILIFHTHSKEAFADSVSGDENSSIVGVGEHLAEILRNEYGFQVLHHTESYDGDGRDEAYTRALVGLEQVLKENPSLQVVIDLHRDEMPENTKLVMDLDGRPTAKFMFFNGISRTKKTGDIAYLYNQNLENNLAFSFQMQLKAAEYYPGITRKIYLKGYRYNMHLMDKYLLVELGAQNNTLEEAMNACDPLAHILSMVLSEPLDNAGFSMLQ